MFEQCTKTLREKKAIFKTIHQYPTIAETQHINKNKNKKMNNNKYYEADISYYGPYTI